MRERVILDLCGGSGSWSKPYRDAGYDVRLVTLPSQDVRLYAYPGEVHGILAAPPCTLLSKAGARWWKHKTEEDWRQALSVVDACLRLVAVCKPRWWALENPEGRCRLYLGKPAFKFEPCWYGDPWTKKTLLWGSFSAPEPTRVVEPRGQLVDLVRDPARRSITPAGFARAFFLANP